MAVREEVQIALYELRKNLRSKKGIAMFVLFFLGGVVPSVARILIENAAKSAHIEDVPEQAKHEMMEKSLLALYRGDHAIASYLADCPPVLFFLFQGTLLFLPLLTILVGFDQIAGEVQHRSIRYIIGRAQRHSIVIGKALGVWGVVATMVLVLHVVVWCAMIAQSDYTIANTLSWGARLWLFSIAFAASYVGLVNLVSSWFKTPVLALFIGAGVAFGLWLARLILLAIGDSADTFTYAFPSTYEHFMVSPDPLRVLGGCALAIGWGAVAVGLSSMIVRKRDL